MNPEARAQTYRETLDRFDNWIEANREPDGKWREPTSADGYFSIVHYAHEIGRTDWALGALHQVEQRFLDDSGWLIQGPNRAQMMMYVPAWLAWGANELECFELTRTLLDQICSYQCGRSGGVFASDEGKAAGEGVIDFDSTGIATIALARAGRIGPCIRAADFFVELFRAQPDPDEQFYTAWHQPGGLEQGAAETAPTTVLRWPEPSQHLYKVGIVTMALVSAYGATGNREYLEVGTQLHDLAVARTDHLWTNTISHKMCWAATCLHSVTGKPEYMEHACRFADHLVTLQQENGAFHYPDFWPTFPSEDWSGLPNCGCQFALWIARTLARLPAVE